MIFFNSTTCRQGVFVLQVASLALLFLLLSSTLCSASARQLPSLFRKAEVTRQIPLKTGEMPVHIDLSLLHPKSTPNTLQADMPDRMVVLKKTAVQSRKADSYTWFGKVEGHTLSSAVMSVVNGVLFGHVDLDGESYSITPASSGYLVARQDSTRRLPFDQIVLVPSLPARPESAAPAFQYLEDGSVIHVMVLYTQQMLTKYGSSLDALIQHYVDLANMAYQNSGINTRLQLVHAELFNADGANELKAITNALSYITYDSTVASIRDNYKADLVCLLRVLTPSNTACGIAWVMQDVSPYFADYAFSVVEVRSIAEANPYYCDERTFAHEVGHNQGCAHDRDHAGSTAGAYGYSYGYDVRRVFGTVMSYDGPTITYFSTPLIDYYGYPIGKDVSEPDSAYNVLSINNTRTTVANFRVSKPTVSHEDILNLVTKYYNDILNRAPEPGGSEGWTAEIERIVALGIDVKEGFIAVGKFFFNSDEYLLNAKADEQYVVDLYHTFLGRTPSQDEIRYWQGFLLQGLGRNVVLNYFAYSEEFRLYMQNIFGNSAARPENNLVNDFYRGFLNRLPETAGFQSYLELMRTSQCSGGQAIKNLSQQIALGFLQSMEYTLRNRTDREFIEDLYNGLLRRGAHPDEFNFWLDFLIGDVYTWEEELNFFVTSDEFQLRVQQLIDSGCLN